MSNNSIQEARRQIEICNACRYCESLCSVFPAITRERQFSDGDINQLANLCHNCRGCYYACQYTEPHEFAVNIPQVLAEIRQQSWREHVAPSWLVQWLQHSGLATLFVFGVSLLLLLALGAWMPVAEGQGFYGVLSHNQMVAVFMPAFVLPLLVIGIAVKRYWHSVGGEPVTLSQLYQALQSAAQMRNLDGGHGKGCNYEDEDRFSQLRRYLHQMTLYGFLLCFAATSVATILHYAFNDPAPYPFFSLPKLFGISGGILLSIGTFGLAWLKTRGDKQLDNARVWHAEMAFVLLLCFVSTSGLLLYALADTVWMPWLLNIHLASVLSFFLLMPYTKMVHGFFRLAALVRDEQLKQPS